MWINILDIYIISKKCHCFEDSDFLPYADVTASLQPCLKPGSIPSTTFPLIGGVSNRRFRLAEKTSTDAFSAVFVNSDLQTKVFNDLHIPHFTNHSNSKQVPDQ